MFNMEINNELLVEQYNEEYKEVVLPVTIFIGIETVIGFFGNLLVIYVFLFRYHECNFKYFVLCLALVDFLSTLTTMPGEMLTLLRWFTFPNNTICKIKSYFNICTFSCETFCLLIIAIDRYRKVCVPFGWQIKTRVAYLLCILINAVAAIIAIPVAFLWGERRIHIVYKETNITLTLCEKDEKFADTKHPFEYVIPLLVFYAICFAVMLFLYIFVARKLRNISISGDNATGLPPSSSGLKHSAQSAGSSADKILQSDANPELNKTSFSSETDCPQNQENKDTSNCNLVTDKDQPPSKQLTTLHHSNEKHTGNTKHPEGNNQNEIFQCNDEISEDRHTEDQKDQHSTIKCSFQYGVPLEDQNRKIRLKTKTPLVKKTRRSENRLKRTTLIMLILTSIFIVTSVCYRTMMSLIAEGDVLEHISNSNRAVYFFFMRLYFINHVINPIVYYVLDPTFHKVINNFKQLICCRTVKAC